MLGWRPSCRSHPSLRAKVKATRLAFRPFVPFAASLLVCAAGDTVLADPALCLLPLHGSIRGRVPGAACTWSASVMTSVTVPVAVSTFSLCSPAVPVVLAGPVPASPSHSAVPRAGQGPSSRPRVPKRRRPVEIAATQHPSARRCLNTAGVGSGPVSGPGVPAASGQPSGPVSGPGVPAVSGRPSAPAPAPAVAVQASLAARARAESASGSHSQSYDPARPGVSVEAAFGDSTGPSLDLPELGLADDVAAAWDDFPILSGLVAAPVVDRAPPTVPERAAQGPAAPPERAGPNPWASPRAVARALAAEFVKVPEVREIRSLIGFADGLLGNDNVKIEQ